MRTLTTDSTWSDSGEEKKEPREAYFYKRTYVISVFFVPFFVFSCFVRNIYVQIHNNG